MFETIKNFFKNPIDAVFGSNEDDVTLDEKIQSQIASPRPPVPINPVQLRESGRCGPFDFLCTINAITDKVGDSVTSTVSTPFKAVGNFLQNTTVKIAVVLIVGFIVFFIAKGFLTKVGTKAAG